LELIRINVLGLFINILALVLALVIDEFGVDNTLGIGGVFVLLLIICYYLYVMLKALFSEGFLDQQEKTDIEIIKYKTADDKKMVRTEVQMKIIMKTASRKRRKSMRMKEVI